jgi:dUTP pyrophosphatase
VELGVTRLHEGARLPSYSTPGSVGFDLWTAEPARIEPMAIELVGTGLVVAVPAGWCLLVSLRSSAPRRYGVMQPHGVGIIDQDYRGPEDELRIQLLNVGTETVEIPAGTRLAQGVLLRSDQAAFVEHVPDGPSRGGFGSTGA